MHGLATGLNETLRLLEPRGGLWVKARWGVLTWDVISVSVVMSKEEHSREPFSVTQLIPVHSISATSDCPPTVPLEIFWKIEMVLATSKSHRKGVWVTMQCVLWWHSIMVTASMFMWSPLC